MAEPVNEREQDSKGASRLILGAWIGLFAAVLAIVVPVVALMITALAPSGLFSLGSGLLQVSGTLIVVGAVLYILSLFIYRRAFAALRKVDPQFWFASILCLVGSVGFILIIVAAAILAGTASSVISCVHGQPSHALGCLESGQPLGAYSALIGFACAWLGGIGVVLGLTLSSDRFVRRTIAFGALVYLVFLFALLIPFVELVARLPGIGYLLVILPILSVAAPLLVLAGARPVARQLSRAA